MGKRILVTGGAGYVGSHACKALAAAGYEPVVYDNLSQGHRWAVKWGPLVVGDIADGALLRRTLRRFDIGAVMHFAAHAYVGESMAAPRKYFANNVAGTLSLLDAMLDCGVSRLVFSSSCATYGLPRELPIAEDHPQQPVSPYGASKLMVENMLGWYGQAYGLAHVSLRYFNAAGTDEAGEIGEAHHPETHLIPLAIAAAQGRIARLTVFGTDYDTPDGTAIRDYVHVADLADAHVKALDGLLGGMASCAFNLGTGRGHSIREVVSAVEAVAGRRIPTEDCDRRPGDPPALVASAERAASALGWRPRRSDLTTIVETAWRWDESRRYEAAESLDRRVGNATALPTHSASEA
ncbi:MAG TPA: UDP-glucose 4-epimerase GalE [Afifellaceae bacterium]|nr:UDP-glucose 4-epimerase GalE [Afifellaceae bacterium]